VAEGAAEGGNVTFQVGKLIPTVSRIEGQYLGSVKTFVKNTASE
jgi:hypothetical protein